MKYWDQVLAVAAVLLGLCCLLLAWMGFSGSPLTNNAVAGYVTVWAPILGLLCMIGAGHILIVPLERLVGRISKHTVRHNPRPVDRSESDDDTRIATRQRSCR
jgi:TRAP-type C4-dicarboxylate transport system permease small subunit